MHVTRHTSHVTDFVSNCRLHLPNAIQYMSLTTLQIIPSREAFPDIVFDEGLDGGRAAATAGPSAADYESQLQQVKTRIQGTVVN